MNQVKRKISILEIKLECAIGQLKGSFIDYTDTKDDEDATEERDLAIAIIQKKWDKMENLAKDLNEATEELTDIVSTSEKGSEIGGDPSTIIATSSKEAKEGYKEYLSFKNEHK